MESLALPAVPLDCLNEAVAAETHSQLEAMEGLALCSLYLYVFVMMTGRGADEINARHCGVVYMSLTLPTIDSAMSCIAVNSTETTIVLLRID